MALYRAVVYEAPILTPVLPEMTLLADSVQGRLLFAIPKKGASDCFVSLDLFYRPRHLSRPIIRRLHKTPRRCVCFILHLIDHQTKTRILAGADIKFFRSNRLDVSVVQNHNIALCDRWRFAMTLILIPLIYR
jgi:hypothetical protein